MGFICDRQSQRISIKASLHRQPTTSTTDNTNGALISSIPQSSQWSLDDIKGAAEKTRLEEIEGVADLDMAKDGGETIGYSADQRLVRKLDLVVSAARGQQHFLLTATNRIFPLKMVRYRATTRAS
jgi:hypothetical protein